MKRFLIAAMLCLAACSSPDTTPQTVATTPVVKTPVVTVPFGKQQTERLRGSWAHTFRIINTYTDRHQLTSTVTESTSTPGDFLIVGRDEFGRVAGGSYSNSLKKFLVLTLTSSSISFNNAYVFSLDIAEKASGCYFLYYKNGDISDCYGLSGQKTEALLANSFANESIRSASVASVQNIEVKNQLSKLRQLLP